MKRCTNCDPESLGQTYRPEWKDCPKCIAAAQTEQRAASGGVLKLRAAVKWVVAETSYCAHCQTCSECGTTGAEMERHITDPRDGKITELPLPVHQEPEVYGAGKKDAEWVEYRGGCKFPRTHDDAILYGWGVKMFDHCGGMGFTEGPDATHEYLGEYREGGGGKVAIKVRELSTIGGDCDGAGTVTGNRTHPDVPTLEQSMDHRAWSEPPRLEPIDEPGWPVPVPQAWRDRADPTRHRDVDCARASACAGIAAKLGWHQYGCSGCPLTDRTLDPPPPHRRAKRCLRKTCDRIVTSDRREAEDPMEPAGYFCSARCVLIHLRRTA